MTDIAKYLQVALQEEKECDVVLNLKSQKVLRCHSLVLRLTGEFFRSFFSENWRGNGAAEKSNVDCSAFEDEAVIGMVNFMYGVDCKIDETNVEEFLSCASYFCVAELTDKCEHYLTDNLDNGSVFKVMVLSDKYSLVTLYNKCLQFVDTHFGDTVAGNDDFQILPKHLLLEIIRRNTLSANEECLFDQIIMWVERNKSQWDDIVPNIRFLSMSLDYVVSKCLHLPLVNEQCKEKILMFLTCLHYSSDELADLGICVEARKVQSERDVFLLRCPSVSDAPSWKPDMLNGDRILMCSDQDTRIKGVSLFGAPQLSILACVSVHEMDDNNLLEEAKCRIDFGERFTALVHFKSCIDIRAGKDYTFVLKCKGNATYFGTSGLTTNTLQLNDGTSLKVTFQSAAAGQTTVHRGQFHGFLFPA